MQVCLFDFFKKKIDMTSNDLLGAHWRTLTTNDNKLLQSE